MKAYLIITGAIFALMALMHLMRAVAEWHSLATNPSYFLGMAALGVLAAALSFWAWRLLLRPTRP